MSRKEGFIDSPFHFSYDNSMQADDIRSEEKPSLKQSPSNEPAQGFLQRLFSLLGGEEDPLKARRRLLRDVAKQLKGSRYKFYRPKDGEALPGVAFFLHEIYTIVGPGQSIIDRAESSSVLKTIIIESALDAKQLELNRYLSEEAIGDRAATMGAKELAADLKQKLLSYFAIFDADRVRHINSVHETLSVFLELLRFDYHYFLKKFDPHLPEHDPKYLPHFVQINGEYIVEELKDFLSVMYLIDLNADWDSLFAVLSEYRQVEIVSRSGWQRLLKLIGDVRRSRVLELVVKYAEHDPYYKVKVVNLAENIVEEHLAKIRATAENAVQKMSQKNRERKVEMLTTSVFGAPPGERMKNYNEKANALFSQRLVGNYLYAPHLNCLKAFLLDYFKKDIREIADLLLVRGRWSTPLMSQQLSEAFHILLETSDELLAFDESLSETGDTGIRIHGLLRRADRDKAALKILREVIKEINDTALEMIQKSAKYLVVMGKNFKIVLEDQGKSVRELLLNWKEIEAVSDGKIKAKVIDAYKKIYYFIQLLQVLLKGET